METNGIDFGWKLVLACGGLAVFGMVYNWLVAMLQKRTQGHYTAELVVIGVLVTVLVSGLFIGPVNVIIILILFSASGAPMILGSWLRVAYDHEQAKKEQAQK